MLGYLPAERVSLNWQTRPRGRFTSRIVDAAELPAAVGQVPQPSCVWFGVNPTSAQHGRGTAADVTRLAALYCELDDDDTSPAQMAAILADIIRVLGEPAAVVASGHGRHVYWPVTGGTITDEFTRDDAAALLARLYRIVCAVAAQHGAGTPDNVCELARVLRVPGTVNHKRDPVPVTLTVNAHADALTVADARQRLDAAEQQYPAPPAPPPPPVAPGDSSADRRYALATLDSHAGQLAGMAPETGRNNALNAAALRCYRLADGAGMDRAIVTATLTDAAQRAGTEGIAGTLASAARKADQEGAAYRPNNSTGPDLGDTTVTAAELGAEDQPHDGEPRPGTDKAAGWQPMDLGPYLRGEIRRPTPELGPPRSDGLRFLYPGKEHAIIGETESGKTWFALGAAAVEMKAGRDVVYIHYEEADPGSTIERLRRLGLPDATIAARLRFVAPINPVQSDWLAALLDPAPRLVIHDGVNEAMALHSAGIKDVEGAAEFRRRLILPCLRAGAATLACDHLPMIRDAGRRDAIGSVHKGNALDGARILLENVEPFGRGLRGASRVYITKDRPGYLRAQGEPSRAVPGKTYMGTLVVDDTDSAGPDFMTIWAPKADSDGTNLNVGPDASPVADAVVAVIAAQDGQRVESWRQLCAHLRAGGHKLGDAAIRDAVDDLVVAQRITAASGPRGATAYQLTPATAAGASNE
ncbi:hypothetical protein [Mycolicibacter terrae]|uniref:hypothetical protein n=1 Tax=Mycolicibacter terrae TaxID=1788 RepID=UPI001F23166B|nr:hypothetical protein [Mycolicibacter terrae]